MTQDRTTEYGAGANLDREETVSETGEIETRDERYRDQPTGSVEVETAPGMRPAEDGGLLPPEDAGRFRASWESIQASFVDEPRESVRRAEELVSEVFKGLTDAFGRHRDDLEQKWNGGGDISTEEMRLTVQRYRTLFQRLLSA